MRLVTRLLPAAVALLVVSCTAKPVASTSGPADPATPRYSGPPVITESALPPGSTGSTGSTDGMSNDGMSNDDGSSPSYSGKPSAPPSTAAGSVPAADGLAGCALPYLRVTVRPAVARSAHAGYLLSFTNTGQIACRLTGYPTVMVLSSAGRPVLRANPTPSGYLGGTRGRPATVLVGAGQPASALLEGEQIDLAGNRCPSRPSLEIIPPGSTAPSRLPISTAICGGVQIHPIVGGNTGSSR